MSLAANPAHPTGMTNQRPGHLTDGAHRADHLTATAPVRTITSRSVYEYRADRILLAVTVASAVAVAHHTLDADDPDQPALFSLPLAVTTSAASRPTMTLADARRVGSVLTAATAARRSSGSGLVVSALSA